MTPDDPVRCRLTLIHCDAKDQSDTRAEAEGISVEVADFIHSAKTCSHRRFIVDKKMADVECGECSAKINPIAALVMLAEDEARLTRLIKRQKELADLLDKKQRTKCQHCGKMTKVRI